MAALAELLRHNPNGLLVYRDELVSLLRALDQEENAEARAFYLTGWNGDSSYTVDRIGRGMNLHVSIKCIIDPNPTYCANTRGVRLGSTPNPRRDR